MSEQSGVTGALSDGTGVSQLGLKKIIKDLVLDAGLSIPASLAAVNIASLESAVVAPVIVTFAIGNAIIGVVFRAIMRWAQT